MLPSAHFVPDLPPEKIERYERLCSQRRDITRKIKDLLRDAPKAARPTWGPCTRCGGTWRGKWPQRKPRCCAKCGNLYWDVPYATPESEEVGRKMRAERQRARDARFLAHRDEVAEALQTLHRHGVTVPTSVLLPSKTTVPAKPNGRSGPTPPPPSALENITPFAFPARHEPPQPERELVSRAKGSGVTTAAPAASSTSASVVGAQEVGDHLSKEAPDAEIPAPRQSEDDTHASGELQEAPGCCSKPILIEGICLNCGAGLERKVVATDDDIEQ